jgi:hypothetical protein
LSDTLQPEQKSHCFLQTYEKNYTVLSELQGINRVATHYSNLV